jgi:hypothetical protein
MEADFANSGAFWISFVAVLIALFAAFVSYAVYRNQADPDVIVYGELDDDRSSIMNLVISNVGNGAAYDVSFESSGPVPADAFGLDKNLAPDAEIMDSGPLITGIPFLPPGGRRTITWGQYGGLTKALGTETIWVTAKYRSHHIGIPWRIRHTSKCPLEVVSFERTDASDRNYIGKVANGVEALTKSVDKVSAAITKAGEQARQPDSFTVGAQ